MSDFQKTYLITGGAGFIGSNFVKYLLAKDNGFASRIIILDALTYAGNLSTLAKEIELLNVTFIHGNISDTGLVEEIFDIYDPDFVVNFAAESHVDRSIENPRLFLETNLLGTQSLLEVARKNWLNPQTDVSRKRFLQISTDEVYGSLERTFTEPQKSPVSGSLKTICGDRTEILTFGHGLFTERSPLSPRSPYSASKAASDMLVQAYGETYGLPVLITRCSNNYGPYQFPEKLIPLIINNLREGKELPVYGEGKNVRDWLYVGDHVRAIDIVLQKGLPGEVYNIGGLNEMENISIVKTIIEIYADLTHTTPRYDLITYVKDRPGHDMRYAIDPSKTAHELGWAPKTTFIEGIEKTIRWNTENTVWIDSVTSGEYRNYYSKMYDNR